MIDYSNPTLLKNLDFIHGHLLDFKKSLNFRINNSDKKIKISLDTFEGIISRKLDIKSLDLNSTNKTFRFLNYVRTLINCIYKKLSFKRRFKTIYMDHTRPIFSIENLLINLLNSFSLRDFDLSKNKDFKNANLKFSLLNWSEGNEIFIKKKVSVYETKEYIEEVKEMTEVKVSKGFRFNYQTTKYNGYENLKEYISQRKVEYNDRISTDAVRSISLYLMERSHNDKGAIKDFVIEKREIEIMKCIYEILPDKNNIPLILTNESINKENFPNIKFNPKNDEKDKFKKLKKIRENAFIFFSNNYSLDTSLIKVNAFVYEDSGQDMLEFYPKFQLLDAIKNKDKAFLEKIYFEKEEFENLTKEEVKLIKKIRKNKVKVEKLIVKDNIKMLDLEIYQDPKGSFDKKPIENEDINFKGLNIKSFKLGKNKKSINITDYDAKSLLKEEIKKNIKSKNVRINLKHFDLTLNHIQNNYLNKIELNIRKKDRIKAVNRIKDFLKLS